MTQEQSAIAHYEQRIAALETALLWLLPLAKYIQSGACNFITADQLRASIVVARTGAHAPSTPSPALSDTEGAG